MVYQYIFEPIAANEYEEAFSWYEEKSIVAADNLIVVVEDALSAKGRSSFNRTIGQTERVHFKLSQGCQPLISSF